MRPSMTAGQEAHQARPCEGVRERCHEIVHGGIRQDRLGDAWSHEGVFLYRRAMSCHRPGFDRCMGELAEPDEVAGKLGHRTTAVFLHPLMKGVSAG